MSLSAALSEGLRDALLAHATIPARLGLYEGSPSIHTRRPIPAVATARPAIAIGPNVFKDDQDLLRNRIFVIGRDVITYGGSGAPGADNDQYRIVEEIADEVHDLFHRNRESLLVDGYHVVDVVARGPIASPTDNERLIGRAVPLTIRLHRTA
jgi:hypothetical protein